jgi:hypothetical protein
LKTQLEPLAHRMPERYRGKTLPRCDMPRRLSLRAGMLKSSRFFLRGALPGDERSIDTSATTLIGRQRPNRREQKWACSL